MGCLGLNFNLQVKSRDLVSCRIVNTVTGVGLSDSGVSGVVLTGAPACVCVLTRALLSCYFGFAFEVTLKRIPVAWN